MNDAHAASAAASDAHSYAVGRAEEAFIFQAQCEIENLMKLKGVRPRELSRRMKVSEARISQLLGDNGRKNLTLRTIARIFHCLNETPHLVAASALPIDTEIESEGGEIEQAIHPAAAGKWTINDGLQKRGASTRTTVETGSGTDRLPSSKHKIKSWASVELDTPEPPSTTSRAK